MVALLYSGGLLLDGFLHPPLVGLFVASLSLAVAALLWAKARPQLLWPLIVLIGWTNLSLRTAIISPDDLRVVVGEQIEYLTLRGTLPETPHQRVYEYNDEKTSWRTMAQIDVGELRFNQQTWRPVYGRVAVSTPGALPTDFFAGQTLEITGILGPPKGAVAEGLFDYKNYLSQQGVYYQLQTASADDWRIIASPSHPPLADRFRAWARKALAIGLPAEDESLRLEWALTLGWKTALTDDVSEPFIRAATYHIFAVDGLRMAIIFGICFGLFRVLGLPRAVCGLLLIPLIWFYTAMTGWPASAIRATIMLTIIIVGWAFKRPSDLINSLFAAALLILVWEPQQLLQAGFQLSFLVVLCIILIIPVLKKLGQNVLQSDPLLPDELRPRWQRILRLPTRFTLDLLLTSFAAWLGCIPLVAYYFHIITPVSAPANLITVPLCALVLVSNLISLLLAGWFPGGTALFNHAAWFLMECIRVTSHWFADWPAAYSYVSSPSLFTLGLYYLIVLTVLTGWIFKSNRRAWKIGALALLALFWCFQQCQQRAETRFTVLPLKGGHAVYLDAPGRKNDWLIDCGNTNAVQFIVKPFLRAHGVNHLNQLLLTHGDLRQVGGAKILADTFVVNHIVTSPIRFRSPTYRNILERLERTPEKWQQVARKDQLGPWTVLHPKSDDRFPQADDSSLVLLGNFQGTRILLLSDLGRPGQNALLERTPDLRADILVAGLPAENEPLNDALLDAIQPRVIIIADSEFPATRRASSKLRERLSKRNVPVIYTRSAGEVTFSLRQNHWELRTMSGGHFSSQARN